MNQGAQEETHVAHQVTNVRSGRETATMIQTAVLACCVERITADVAITGRRVTTAAITEGHDPIYIIYSSHNLLCSDFSFLSFSFNIVKYY